jgi:hypothetical protein
MRKILFPFLTVQGNRTRELSDEGYKYRVRVIFPYEGRFITQATGKGRGKKEKGEETRGNTVV